MGANRDRYQPSRESVSSATGNEESGDLRSTRGSGGGNRMNSLSSYPDAHQVFVGNLPHQCQESHLEELFNHFGKVWIVFSYMALKTVKDRYIVILKIFNGFLMVLKVF